MILSRIYYEMRQGAKPHLTLIYIQNMFKSTLISWVYENNRFKQQIKTN